MPRFQIYACIVAVVIIAWASIVCVTPFTDPRLRITEDFHTIPMTIPGWSGIDQAPDVRSLGILTTCSILGRSYKDNQGNEVGLSIVYGRDLGDFHQPENCMRGAGWTVTGLQTVEMHPKGLPAHKATLVTLQNESQMEEMMMVYWFYMAGQISPTMNKNKVAAILEGFGKKGLQPSAMVKFYATISMDNAYARKNIMEVGETLEASILDTVKKQPKYEQSDKILKELKASGVE
jgi:EpsI family protein